MSKKDEKTHVIGVIADTHDRFNPSIRQLFADVDEIWHLGDICEEFILDELRAIQPRLTIVRGNNDISIDAPPSLRLEREGENFYLSHVLSHIVPRNISWVLYGHVHRPRNDTVGGIHYFCPGSAGLANKGYPCSIGFLTKEVEKTFSASVVTL